MKKIIYTLLFSTLLTSLYAQNINAAKIQPTVGGQLMLAFNKDYGYLNFYGPGLRLVYKKWAIGGHVLPSLQYKFEKNTDATDKLPATAQFSPNMGASIIVSYSRFSIGVPVYYISAKRVWKPALGVAYRFGK